MTSRTLLRPLLLGLATGMRSQLGLAALAWSGPARTGETAALRTLRSPAGRAVVALAAAGELVGDKLPQTPSRLKAPVFGSRLVIGALVGGMAGGSADRGRVRAAVAAGVLGAAAGTYAGARYRTVLPARTGTPDLPWALGEDLAAVGLAARAVAPRRSGRSRWARRG